MLNNDGITSFVVAIQIGAIFAVWFGWFLVRFFNRNYPFRVGLKVATLVVIADSVFWLIWRHYMPIPMLSSVLNKFDGIWGSHFRLPFDAGIWLIDIVCVVALFVPITGIVNRHVHCDPYRDYIRPGKYDWTLGNVPSYMLIGQSVGTLIGLIAGSLGVGLVLGMSFALVIGIALLVLAFLWKVLDIIFTRDLWLAVYKWIVR